MEILDAIEAEKIEDTFSTLDLGIIREETVGGTMLTDEILKCFRHIRLRLHGVDNSLRAILSNE